MHLYTDEGYKNKIYNDSSLSRFFEFFLIFSLISVVFAAKMESIILFSLSSLIFFLTIIFGIMSTNFHDVNYYK